MGGCQVIVLYILGIYVLNNRILEFVNYKMYNYYHDRKL
jgi:hypothetical protein